MRALDIYHRMPHAGRAVAASARGAQLAWWRYGGDAEELVAAALERDRWSPERWRSWQDERTAEMLLHAARTVPHYRDEWTRRRRAGDRSPVEDLASWPLLDKHELRADPERFVSDDAPRLRFEDHTSGTTGTPLRLWLSRSAVRRWYALTEARLRRWHGVSRHESWGLFGGQLVTPPDADRPPYWIRNRALRQWYFSTYHLSPRTLADYAGGLRRAATTHLIGYPSALAELAALAIEAGVTLPPQRAVLANAEPVSTVQRRQVEAAFGVPLRETYGMAEAVAAASECEEGELHTWPDAGVIETVDDDGASAAGDPGRLVATGLLNRAMPLVRYVVGDRVVPTTRICACGRTLPVLDAIEGRQDDAFLTTDGRRVGRLDPVFKADLPIREAQLVQTAVGQVLVRVVPAPGYGPATEEAIRDALRARLGETDTTFDRVDRIAREANGKFRMAVSLVQEAGDELRK